MPLQDQVIPIHSGQGIQSKVDPKLVPAGPVLRLENAVFTKQGAVNKRNGYDKLPDSVNGGGTLPASRNMLSELNGELVCGAGGNLYAYNSSQAKWNSRGTYQPFKTSVFSVASSSDVYADPDGTIRNVNAANTGNYALYTWGNTPIGGGNVDIISASIVDTTNNNRLVTTVLLSTGCPSSRGAPPFVLTPGSTLACFISNSIGNPTVAIASPSLSLIAAPVLVNSDFISGIMIAAVGTPVDGGAVLAYFVGTDLKLVKINSSAVQTGSIVVSAGSTGHALRIVYDSGLARVWIYYVDNTTVKYAIYDAITLSTILSPTSVHTDAEYANAPIAFAVAKVSPTVQQLVYGYQSTSTLGASESNWTTKTITVNSAGSPGTFLSFKSSVVPISDVFQLDGVFCVTVLYQSANQPMLATYRVGDKSLIGKTLAGTAQSAYASSIGLSVCNVLALSASKVTIPILYNSGFVLNEPPTVGLVAAISFDSSNIDLYQTAVANNNLVMNGGQIYAYDGSFVTEVQFHLAPQIVSATHIGAGTTPAAGTYIYYATYLWIDGNGNIQESAPSLAVTYTSGSTGSVRLIITGLAVTLKQNVNVRIYRTLNTGTVPHLVATVQSGNSGSLVTYDDTATDASISASPELYTAAGAVLDNNSPPPATAMLVKNNRLWVVSDEAKNEVWYSKTFVSTGGVNFSGFLLENVDISGDQIVALASMDDKIVYFSDKNVYITAGDGANDTGNGSTLSLPQLVPTDTGCSQSSGVITFPTGVMTKTAKGIYLLDRALNFQYFGAPMERYNSQTIKATQVIKTKSQIRFLCSDGPTLVYDYIFNQWSVFTNHTGVSATLWNGVYTYLTTAGDVYTEHEGYYLDNTTSFAVLIQTAWLSFAQVQGFERVKQFLTLGDYANGSSSLHGIQSSMAYDFQSTFTSTNPFYFSDASPYQYRTFLPQQKCDSVSILIQELVTGDSAEYVTFTDMSFLAGVKKGINKKSAASSVG